MILFQTVIDFPPDGSTVSPVHNEPSTMTVMKEELTAMTKDESALTAIMTAPVTALMKAPTTAVTTIATTGITKTSFSNQKTVINIPTHFQDSSFDNKLRR